MASNSERGRRPLQNWGAWKMTPEALKKGPPETLESCFAAPSTPPKPFTFSLPSMSGVQGADRERSPPARGLRAHETFTGSGRGAGAPSRASRLPSPSPDAGGRHKAQSGAGGSCPRGSPPPGKRAGGWEPGKRPPPSLAPRSHSPRKERRGGHGG